MSITKLWLKKQGDSLKGQDAKILFKILKNNRIETITSSTRVMTIVFAVSNCIFAVLNSDINFWISLFFLVLFGILTSYIEHKQEKEMESEL